MSGATKAAAHLPRATAEAAGAYIFGAICPTCGIGAALVMPYADKQAMTLHLAEISQAVTLGAHAVVIIDGAGWHKPGGRLTLRAMSAP